MLGEEAVLNEDEDILELDEERILTAFERSKHEKTYDHDEVWEMLGL